MGIIPIKIFSSIFSWRKSELQAIGKKPRKLFTIYADRLYVPRKESGRGLISIEDSVELVIRGLEVYVHGSEKKLIKAARLEKMDGLETVSVLKRSKKEKRLED